MNLYIKIDGGDRSFRGLKFLVWYLSKVWRYLLASFRVLSENIQEKVIINISQLSLSVFILELVPLSGKIIQTTATKQILVPFSGTFQNLRRSTCQFDKAVPSPWGQVVCANCNAISAVKRIFKSRQNAYIVPD